MYASVAISRRSSVRSTPCRRSSTSTGGRPSSANAPHALPRRALTDAARAPPPAPPPAAPEGEHAEQPLRDGERHAEQRLDPLLAHEGADELDVVELARPHGRAALGHDPGEAAADRHAHPALHVALESLRGVRDE